MPLPRRQRADATRNRARLLEAADAVLSERGPAGTTEEIARRAGIAVGTVFRHFPTKEALIAAVFTQRLQRLSAEAHQLRDSDNPVEALREFFVRWTELSATKQAFVEDLRGSGVDVAAVAADSVYPQVRAELFDGLATLVERAKEARGIRSDIGAEEVWALMIGAVRAVEHLAPRGQVSRRITELVFNGLRRQTSSKRSQ